MKQLNALFFLLSLIAISVLYLHLNGIASFLGTKVAYYALALGLLIPFFLLFFGYTQLRDIKVFLVWLLLGAGMLVFYIYFKDHPSLQLRRGSALRSFRSLFFFLIMFQVGRQIFIRMMGLEYVTPSKGGSNDQLEGIKPQ